MYKLIALDMDDTFLTSELIISKKNKDMIKKVAKMGIKVVLCSGRASKSMAKYIEELKDYCDEYFISYNGAIITDVKNDKKLFYHPLKKEIVHKLIDIGREKDINVQIYKDDSLYVEKYNKYTESYESLTDVKAKVVGDLKDITENGSIKVLYNYDHDELEKLKPELESKFSSTANIFFSKPNYLEALNIKANKGIALKELVDYLDIKLDETISIGDSFNDLSMIQMAGLGVAMKNGHKNVKSEANYITINDHNNDGVAEVLDKFIIKNL